MRDRPSWTLRFDFNDGEVGTKVAGLDAAGGTRYTTEQSFEGGKAAVLQAQRGRENYGRWGGGVTLPDALRKGDEIWWRVRTFWPKGMDYSANPRLKFLRIRTHSAAGKHHGYDDIYINTPGSKEPFQFIYEGGSTWSMVGTAEDAIVPDTWETYEYYLKLDNVAASDGGQARVRFWKNGKLLKEITDRETLKDADGYAKSALLFTYWNSSPYVGQITFEEGGPFSPGELVTSEQHPGCAFRVERILRGAVYLIDPQRDWRKRVRPFSVLKKGERLAGRTSGNACVISEVLHTHPVMDIRMYVDDMVLTCATPGNTDAHGNPMIGAVNPEVPREPPARDARRAPSASPAQGSTAGRDYVVSAAGSDQAGDGSLGKPFATIGKGLELAQPGDRVLLRAGEYRVAEHGAPGAKGGSALRFPRAGEPGRPITLAAYGDDYVALLGSVRLKGWQRHEGRVWKCAHPPRHVRGLYEDGERLTHPRRPAKREDPDVSALTWSGTWTQDAGWVYLWTREGDSPDSHRIEASQRWVVDLDRQWLRLEKLHVFFGQNVCAEISADNCEVVDCEIAHCSNSVDNAYCAYFSGCSNSAFRRCVVHDSYYWGDHGSNSHVVSCIDCGDRGPNFVDACEIFNGGLGVGTKGAAREMVIRDSRIYDVANGITMSGERSSGPGAGKKDRGHYAVWRNRIGQCSRGIFFHSGNNHGNRIWNNLFERCDTGIYLRGRPDRPQIVNNILTGCGAAVLAVAGRSGSPTLHTFFQCGLESHHNLFFRNAADWRNPITWGKDLDLSCSELRQRTELHGRASPEANTPRRNGETARSTLNPPETGSLACDPALDGWGRARQNDGNAGHGTASPTIGAGAELPLPPYLAKPEAWHIGLGPWRKDEQRPEPGLTLSIAGSQTSVRPGGSLTLRAALTNEFRDRRVSFAADQDVILSFHFRYTGWHLDKQEVWRMRVQLRDGALAPGETLDLTGLPGWRDPVNGEAGSAFHLRTRDPYPDVKAHYHAAWKAGCRLRATARLVGRTEETAHALQRLEPLLRSKEVVRVQVK